MRRLTEPTYWVEICMAGDVARAMQVADDFCYRVGLCVTVEPCTYVYTGGREAGFRVRLINYPRFPKEPAAIRTTAVRLAEDLRVQLCQHSFLVMDPQTTTWCSYREREDGV